MSEVIFLLIYELLILIESISYHFSDWRTHDPFVRLGYGAKYLF